jgi:hypothetical protein
MPNLSSARIHSSFFSSPDAAQHTVVAAYPLASDPVRICRHPSADGPKQPPIFAIVLTTPDASAIKIIDDVHNEKKPQRPQCGLVTDPVHQCCIGEHAGS